MVMSLFDFTNSSRGYAWGTSSLVRNNNAHPWVECSNRGECDRDTGECNCDAGFEGIACQRLKCPNVSYIPFISVEVS